MADRAWNAIDNHVYYFTLHALNFPFEPAEYSEAAKGFLPMIPVDDYPYLHGISQQVIDGSHDGMQTFALDQTLCLMDLRAFALAIDIFQWNNPRVSDCGHSMTDAFQVFLVRSECDKTVDGFLAYQ